MFDKNDFLDALEKDEDFRDKVVNIIGENIANQTVIEISNPEAMSPQYRYDDSDDRLCFRKKLILKNQSIES